jgi:hypothetical protein
LQRRLLDLRFKIIGQFSDDLGFDHQPRLAVGDAEEAPEHLIRRDRIAVARQRFRMRAARDHLAADQHAVAVEDDEVEALIDVWSRFLHADQDLSSSSGTQYNSSR